MQGNLSESHYCSNWKVLILVVSALETNRSMVKTKHATHDRRRNYNSFCHRAAGGSLCHALGHPTVCAKGVTITQGGCYLNHSLRYTRPSKAGIRSSSRYLCKCMEHTTEPSQEEQSMDSRATGGICRPGELLAPRFSHVKRQQSCACPQGCFTCVCTGNHSDSLLRLLRGDKLTVPLGHPVLCVGVCA